ncbi:hypothetical protein Poly41_26100 [Novipirellula artificiosorum]|uniref:Uncharacterized protein n=1 Tax=Novipirellula artificiosorum TaxID=2528016 RepID=A0A5C6DU47_9BACT|nr:hypothetical protein Poly41_26100 [Novipirellula artificiosorum]
MLWFYREPSLGTDRVCKQRLQPNENATTDHRRLGGDHCSTGCRIKHPSWDIDPPLAISNRVLHSNGHLGLTPNCSDRVDGSFKPRVPAIVNRQLGILHIV